MLGIHQSFIDKHNKVIVSDPRQFYKFNIHSLHDDNMFIIDKIEKNNDEYSIISSQFNSFMTDNVVNTENAKNHIIITFTLPETQKNISVRCDVFYGGSLKIYKNNKQSNIYGNSDILNDSKKNQDAFEEFKQLFAASPEKFKNIKAYINFSEDEFAELKQKVKDVVYNNIPYDIYDNYAYKFTKNITDCQDDQNNLDISKIKNMNVGDCINFFVRREQINPFEFKDIYRYLYVANLEPFILLELIPIQPSQLFENIPSSNTIAVSEIFKRYMNPAVKPTQIPIKDTLHYQEHVAEMYMAYYDNAYDIYFKPISGHLDFDPPYIMTYKMFSGGLSILETLGFSKAAKIGSFQKLLNIDCAQLDIFKHQYLSPDVNPILIPAINYAPFSNTSVSLYFYTTNKDINQYIMDSELFINLNKNIIPITFKYDSSQNSNSTLFPNDIINLPYIHLFK